jgi:hypothetical protein
MLCARREPGCGEPSDCEQKGASIFDRGQVPKAFDNCRHYTPSGEQLSKGSSSGPSQLSIVLRCEPQINATPEIRRFVVRRFVVRERRDKSAHRRG